MTNKQEQFRIEKRIKKKKKRLKVLLFVFIPLVIILGSVGVFAAQLINKAQNTVNNALESDGREGGSALRDEEVDPGKDSISILFIGIDDSEKRQSNNESSQLSDALILATLNKQDHSVKMLSIPRDSYVYVPIKDRQTKINHAHAYGGPSATIETVEQFLDIPVDYFVRINFNAFMDVVDTLNGITVEVPYEFYEQDSQDRKNAIHLLPGEQTLNGEEALALARTRKLDNDIERGKRQQQIMKAILQKSMSLGSVFKYDDLIEAVGNNMKTNMTFNEMKSLVSYGTSGQLNIETYTLQGSDSRIDGTYYYQVNEESLSTVQQTLKQHLDFEETTAETDTVTE
ncbi:LCP family protein [Gracilibacillus caseinilyticus]|uniref:LCP family protein n=1 Tax=Gracilibacillus caseinilyticus TaxID=2932256 RepID=A0ABY4F182_9BACI|nr:LCP family protein [Gracilibacillus caseinilyticus]UOQ50293.1 LCP family protein [Gracilibacillus caseinilyticus]